MLHPDAVAADLVRRYDRADQRERDRSRKRTRQVDSDDEEVLSLTIGRPRCLVSFNFVFVRLGQLSQ